MPVAEHEALRVHVLGVAFAALTKDKFGVVKRLCNGVLRYHRLDHDALMLLAQSERLSGRLDVARELLEKHDLLAGRSVEHWFRREASFQRLERWVPRELVRNPLLGTSVRLREVEQVLARRLLSGRLDERGAGRAGRALRRLRTSTPSLSQAVLDALARAKALGSDARFEEAFETVRFLPLEPGALVPDVLGPLAQAATATSRYELALAMQAFLAGLDPNATAPLLAAAEVHWTLHREGQAELLARAALALEPELSRATQVLARCERSQSAPRPSSDAVLSHAAFFTGRGGNWGDICLPVAVREAVETRVQIRDWFPIHVHQVFDDQRLEIVNGTKGLVVGGGGLLLPDTSPNGSSGWQWNVTTEALKRLQVPLAVIAVGYNLFKGQDFYSRQFQYSLETLVDRAVLFGLRNGGSLRKVQDRLPARLADKVTFFPCPTCVLCQLHPEYAEPEPSMDGVLINAAYDRSSRRFGEAYPQFLEQMAKAIRTLDERGVAVGFAAHLPSDERFLVDVAPLIGRSLDCHRLYDLELEAAYRVYRRAALVIGMRGHATMIPFGLGVPVLSVVSHPKLRYFLEDIERTEWALDVDAPELGQQLATRALEILADQAAVRRDILRLQATLMQSVSAGVETFRRALA